MLPHGADGGAHRRAGRQAVVHQNHDPAGDARRGLLAPQIGLAPPRFRPLGRGHSLDVGLGDAEGGDDVIVQKPPAVRCDRADRQLGRNRRAQLASDNHIELRIEPPRHLRRDDDSATWQAEDEGVAAPIALEALRQSVARVATVPKQRHAAGTVAARRDAGAPR